MTSDEHLDGNAIAGDLRELFGVEMTTQSGSCAGCGVVSVLAAVRVYRSGPGTVIRCPNCAKVLMVLVNRPGSIRVGIEMLHWLEVAEN